MFTDIVFPRNNEKKFIDVAEKLGVKSLCFVYDAKNKDEIDKINNKIKRIQKTTKIKIFTGIIADASNINKVRRLADINLVHASDRNQEIIEKAKPDIIFNLESPGRKDFIYSRNSGLNQVLCNLANKHNIMVGISINSIIKSKKKNVALGRIKQNIRLCQKYRVKTAIASFAEDPYEMRSPYELRSLLAVLGANTNYQKKSLQNSYQKIHENNERKNSGYVAEGISIVK